MLRPVLVAARRVADLVASLLNRTLRLPALLLALLMLPMAPPAGADHEVPPTDCFEQIGVDLALVLDRSGSMTIDNRIGASKAAGTVLLNNLGASDQSALVTFSSGVSLDKRLDFAHLGAASTDAALQTVNAGGVTAIWKGIRMAHYELTNHSPIGPAPGAYSGNARLGVAKQAMVILSDGDYTGSNPIWEAAQAKANNIEIFTVALGSGISAGGLQTLEDIATSSGHFHHVLNPNDLQSVFFQISYQIRDLAGPSVDLVRPVSPHQFYVGDAVYGPSTFGLPVVQGSLTPYAIAADDCLIDHVEFEVEFRNSQGTIVSTANLGSIHQKTPAILDDASVIPAYVPMALVCPAGLPGPHTIRATAVDWLQSTAVDTQDFLCVAPAVDADATSVYTRLTHPADPIAENPGAHTQGQVPSNDAWSYLHLIGGTPTAYDVEALDDDAWSQLSSGLYKADARTVQAHVKLGALGIDETALRTTAHAEVNTDASGASPFVPKTSGTHTLYDGMLNSLAAINFPASSLAGPGCQTWQDNGATIKRCWAYEISLAPSLHPSFPVPLDFLDRGTSGEARITLGETVTVTGPGFQEITNNCIHVLVQGQHTRDELIIGQAYSGASILGSEVLRGPWRELDQNLDAGRQGDAPDGPGYWLLGPGEYGARIDRQGDVDVYAIAADIGDKVHAAFLPSSDASATIESFAQQPTLGTTPQNLRVRLLDPNGLVRDAKVNLVGGAPTQVELNVDISGIWLIVVDGYQPTDYSFTLERPPVAWTLDDAATGYDAGATCQDGLLVGPGVHTSAIQSPSDTWDYYRVQLYEGQLFVATLKPGDTIDSAYMRLHFYDRQCNELNWVSPIGLPGGFKGTPQLVNFPVPVGADGIYRLGVEYVNGIGSYELAVATSGAGLLYPIP